MILTKRLKGKAIAAFLGPTGQAARHMVAEAKRRLTKAPERLDFYVDISDPWSYLAAQLIDRLHKAYGFEFALHAVSPPATDVSNSPVLRDKHAVRDAQELAAYWDLSFPGKKPIDPGILRKAGSALVLERSGPEQLECFLEFGDALWRTDLKAMHLLMGKYGTEAQISVPTILATKYESLRKRGHYQGSMAHVFGQWFHVLDRLDALEEALAAATGKPVVGVLHVRPESERPPERLSKKGGPVPVDLWFSFGSPYSYLAIEQIEDVLRASGSELRLRPIAPIKTAVPTPLIKRLYIAIDVKQEADRLGVPFGDICDPTGRGVDHCLALMHFAESRGAGLAFARSALRGIWAEARDMAEYVDLRHVVERAGLSWAEAQAALADPAGAKAASANLTDLGVVGLWGVPSMRAGDFVAWGQDRLPMLADRLRRNAAAGLAPPPEPETAA